MLRGKNKRYKNAALRRKANIGPGGDNRIGTRTPIIPEFGMPSTTHVTVTFNTPVILAGIPAIFDTSSPTITVTSAASVSPTEVALTFNANPTVGVTWPFEDPAVRNMIGGYVQSGDYTFPT